MKRLIITSIALLSTAGLWAQKSEKLITAANADIDISRVLSIAKAYSNDATLNRTSEKKGILITKANALPRSHAAYKLIEPRPVTSKAKFITRKSKDVITDPAVLEKIHERSGLK